MGRHKFISIKEKGGLRTHLDATKPEHRGFGYKTFRILRVAGVNKTAMRKAFNVNFDTMKHWWAIDDDEQRQKKQKAEAEVDSLKSAWYILGNTLKQKHALLNPSSYRPTDQVTWGFDNVRRRAFYR